MKGYTQVYTGDGKGKTTAALGLALRAAGAGLKIYFAQFLKYGNFSEAKALERFPGLIVLKQYGRAGFIRGIPDEEDKKFAEAGLKEAELIMLSGQYQVVVLDEANVATSLSLFPVAMLTDCIWKKPEGVELVITGRNADPKVLEAADLVTEMKEIKHYYQQGIQARIGIEQ
jgi:cob(I)alamin adenosyltransferase